MRAVTLRNLALRFAKQRRALSWAAFAIVSLIGVPAYAQGYQNDAQRCQQLERQLVSEWQRGNNSQEAVAGINQQLQQLRRKRRQMENEADRRDCYEELFIFGRSLRRTPECIKIDRDIEQVRRDLDNLRQQKSALTNSARRRIRRDELVSELARYGCGENYQREHTVRRRHEETSNFFSLWEDEDSSYDRGYANKQQDQSALPFASYRTMCVRLCDGFYFPISFSTLGSRFGEDEVKCKDQCAAPAELFVYKNPGEDVEQMVSVRGEPYGNLKNAWRNRKEYVKGCSCKAEEYSAHEIQLWEQQKKNKQANASGATNGSPATSATSGQASQ